MGYDLTDKFTVGIEEEYLLVDRRTGQPVGDEGIQSAIIDEVKSAIDGSVGMATPEFLKAQVEVGTSVCNSVQEARGCLRRLRYEVAESAGRRGLAPIAASTHPTAEWVSLEHTDKERYAVLAQDLQEVARRLVICGMHIHVGIDSDEHRIDLLGQLAYFLPHLLVLTTSSPFWRGRDTGLKSYRLSVFDQLPRTGLPPTLESWSDYERHLGVLVRSDALADGSKIWWDIRPHYKFPTLEMRVCDICTRLDDGIAVAALYASLTSMLQRLRRKNQKWRSYSTMLIGENRWRAQRYGIDRELIDFGLGQPVPYAQLLDEMIELTEEDSDKLGCADEVAHCRTILKRGTSADNQRRVYEQAIAEGHGKDEALRRVVEWLVTATVEDV